MSPFSILMNDTITIIKKNSGQRLPNLKASVQPGGVFMDHNNVLVEPGDYIERVMSNGATETFEVIDPGFHEAFQTIPANYQMKVRKLGLPEAQRSIQNVYNLSGNARVNYDSIDSSINVQGNIQLLSLVEQLKEVVKNSSLEEDQKRAAIEIVDSVIGQAKQSPPSKAVISALLEALPKVADVATIVGTILSLLK